MNTYVVWIDLDRANIFKILPETKTHTIIKRTEIKHHTHADPENHKNGEKFFHDVSEFLDGAQEILLMGPGLAKKHFRSHLDRHHHSGLAKAIVGVETVDHPTDRQILDLSRRFFKAHDLYA